METGVGVLETLTPQHLLRSTPLPWSPPFREFRPAPLHLETEDQLGAPSHLRPEQILPP